MSTTDVTLKALLVGEDKSMSKTLRGAGDAADTSSGKLGKLGKASGALKGALAAGAIAAATGAVVEFGRAAVDEASNLQQSAGAVEAVFKKQAGQIKAASDTAAESLGLTKNQYNELASTLGAGLKNKGITDFADQTQNLIGIGADLAAQYGGSTSEAVEALSSLMRGERDPIEKYGVTMNEASVQAEALAMGLGKPVKNMDLIKAKQNNAIIAQRKYTEAVKEHGKGSEEALSAESRMISANAQLEKAMAGSTPKLTDQEKAMATLSLLTKQTSDAQGAFGRESETLAGKQQRLDAKWKNLQGTLGDALLPALTEAANIGGKVVDWISLNTDVLGPMAGAIAAATAAFVVLNFVMSANPIGLVVLAIGALVAGLIWAYNNVEWFRKAVDEALRVNGIMWQWLWNGVIAPVLRWILEGFAWVTDGIASMLDALGNVPGFEWAKDAAKAMKAGAEVTRQWAKDIKDIPDAKPKISAEDKASQKIANINKTIRDLKGKKVKAEARGDTKEVDRLKKRISELKGKKVEIKTQLVTTGPTTMALKVTNRGTIKLGLLAKGGTAKAGQPYIVGEEGPELFMPGQTGQVINARKTAAMARSTGAAVSATGGGSTVITNQVIVKGEVVDKLGLARATEEGLSLLSRRRGGKGFRA